MAIWKHKFTLEGINALNADSMAGHLGIVITDYDDDSLTAEMPVNEKTRQPFGILHGGASVVLAETLGSIASFLCLEDPEKNTSVGLEINANHLKSVAAGKVTGICRPIRIGRTIHVWEIDIYDEAKNRICISRITIAIVKRRD